MFRLIHYSKRDITERNRVEGYSTFTNLQRLRDYITANVGDLLYCLQRIKGASEEISALRLRYGDRLIIPDPFYKINTGLTLAEYRTGLVNSGADHHPVIQHDRVRIHVTSACVIEVWFYCCQDHPTFTIELEGEPQMPKPGESETDTASEMLDALELAVGELQRLRNVLLPHYEGKICEPDREVLEKCEAVVAKMEEA